MLYFKIYGDISPYGNKYYIIMTIMGKLDVKHLVISPLDDSKHDLRV